METRKLITFRVSHVESKMEFANNSLNSPKMGNRFRVEIRAQRGLDSLKKPDKKISCYCPFNMVTVKYLCKDYLT